MQAMSVEWTTRILPIPASQIKPAAPQAARRRGLTGDMRQFERRWHCGFRFAIPGLESHWFGKGQQERPVTDVAFSIILRHIGIKPTG